MKKLLIILSFISISWLYSDTRILFYLHQKPIQITDWLEKEQFKIENLEKINEKNPSEISNKLLKNKYKQFITPSLSGFLALYSGYIDYSDPNGEISFPLRHTPPKLYLIITPNIKLIKVKENTISHQEFDENEKENTQIFLFEKKEDMNKEFYWQVTEEKIPENNIINPLSVIILTNPKNLFITTGEFMTNNNKHLILPNNIYVIKNNLNSKILLNFMNIKNFFEQIDIKDKKISETLFEKIISNN